MVTEKGVKLCKASKNAPKAGWLSLLLSTRSILTASGILMAATLGSKVTGFLRLQAIAQIFGANWQTDAFLTAFLIPECLYLFFTEGALSSAFVPLFTKYLVQEDEGGAPARAPAFAEQHALGKGQEAASLLSTLSLSALFLGLPIALFIIVYKHEVARALGPDFSSQTQGLAAALLAIVAFYIPIGLVGGVLQGYLNACRHFLAPALGPLAFNILTVGAAYLFGSTYGIVSLAWAVLLGGVAALLLQLFVLPFLGHPIFGRPNWRHPGVKEAARLLAPVLATVILVQVQVIVERVMASSLVSGSVSSLNFAYKILNLPAGLLALTISTALLPTLAAAASYKRQEEFQERTLESHTMLVWLVAPLSGFLVLCASPIVTLAFQRGAFTVTQAEVTARVLACYGLALLPLAGTFLLTRVFFALNDTLTPAVVKVVATALNIAALTLLLPRIGIVAVPLCFSAMYFLNYIALLYAFGRQNRGTTFSLLREVFIALVAAVVASVAGYSAAPAPAASLLSRVVTVSVPIGVIAILYPLLAHSLGSRATRPIVSRLRSFISKRFQIDR